VDNVEAINLIEDNTAPEPVIREAWQHIVDTHVVWSLQGWYGRTAMNLIHDGFIKPADEEVNPPH
jgi:hypothetical protein